MFSYNFILHVEEKKKHTDEIGQLVREAVLSGCSAHLVYEVTCRASPWWFLIFGGSRTDYTNTMLSACNLG